MAFTKIAGPGITTTDNYRVGVITATKFVGDGSSLTGVASTERIITGTAATFTSLVDINGDLDVDGKTDLDDLSVAGVSTFASTVDINSNVDVSGFIDVDGQTTLDDLNVAGVSTLGGAVDINNNVDISGFIDVDGQTTLDDLNVAGLATVAQLKMGSVTATSILDEDNMASNSAAALATQQSIKAYVDTQVTAQDLDFQADSGGALSIDLDSETLTIAGTTNEIETAGSGNQVTIGLPNNVTVSGNLTVGGALQYEDVVNIDSVGIVTARTGVHIDDSITHIGDTNTKIRFPTTDQISFETAGSERVRINSSGRVIVGQNSSQEVYANGLFQVASTGGEAAISVSRWSDNSSSPYINLGKSRGAYGTPTIVQDGDRLGQINFVGADGTDLATTGAGIAAYVDGTPGSNDMPGSLRFYTTPNDSSTETERLRIDSSGRLLIGVTASRAVNSAQGSFQIEGTGAEDSDMSIVRNQNNSGGPAICFGKSRSGSLAGNTIVQSGDQFGSLIFMGNDGTDLASQGARIDAACDGTPGSNDMPGRITFSTTADGAASATERMRINKAGRLLLGTTIDNVFNGNRNARFQQEGLNAADAAFALCRHSADTGPAFISLGKTRGTSLASNTAVQNGDGIGCIEFNAGDGSGALNTHAKIIAEVDGAPGNSDAPGRIAFYTTPDGGSTTPAERVRIDSSGNIGINQSDPTEKLDVNGTIQCLNELRSTTGNDLLLNAGSANRDVKIQVNDVNMMYVQGSTGKIGMGIDSPYLDKVCIKNDVSAGTHNWALHLLNGTHAGDSRVGLAFQANNNAASNTWDGSGIYAANDGSTGACHTMFGTVIDGSFTERMRIDSSGRLLIGTTTAGHANADELTLGGTGSGARGGLTINAHSTLDGSIHFGDGDSNLSGQINYHHNDNTFRFYTAGTERAAIDNNGNFYFANDTNTFFGRPSSDTLAFSTGGSERLRIKSDGGVVIGSGNGSATMSEFGSNTGGLTIDDAGVSNTGLRLSHGSHDTYLVQTSGGNFHISTYGSADMIFGCGSSGNERLRIDSSGHLHTGYTSSFGSDHVNILATDGGGVSIATNNAGDADSGDVLGSLSFQAYLSGQAHTAAEAKISGIAAENHSGSSAATDLAFYTKPSSTGPGSAPTERLRIASDGKMTHKTINTSSNASGFDTFSGNSINGMLIYNEGNDTASALQLKGNNNSGGSPGQQTTTQLTHRGANAEFEITHLGSRGLNIGSSHRIRVPGVWGVNGSSMRTVQIESDGNLCAPSSIREAKINIESISDVSWLYDFNPVTFNFRTKTEVNGENVWGDEADDGGLQYGLIADEVESVNQDLCFYDDNKLSGVHYDRMIAPLIKALQDQKKEIDALKAEVALLNK